MKHVNQLLSDTKRGERGKRSKRMSRLIPRASVIAYLFNYTPPLNKRRTLEQKY